MRGVAAGLRCFGQAAFLYNSGCSLNEARGGKFSVCRYETGCAGLTASFALAEMCNRIPVLFITKVFFRFGKFLRTPLLKRKTIKIF